MKKLRTLLVRFDNELQPWEVTAFRGAVIEKVGRENLLFHHHLDDHQYYFRYPMLQYKSILRQPSILCLGDGVDEIHKLFNKETWEINLKGKKVDLTIDDLRLGNINLNVWDKDYRYFLNNWLALNERNYKRYKSLTSEIEQTEFLEKILIGNILAFAKGVDWHIDKTIKCRIQKIEKTRNIKYKNTRLMAFNIRFSANVFLPNYIGLGKGASRGYGVLQTKKSTK